MTQPTDTLTDDPEAAFEGSATDQWWEPEDEPPPATGENGVAAINRAPLDKLSQLMSRPTDPDRYTRLRVMKANGKAYRMDDRSKDRACKAYAQAGVLYMAAAAAGVSMETLRQHRRTDEVFEEAMSDAYAEYCASLEMEASRRAFVGVEEPVVGRVGKDEDGVITYVRRYSDRLAEMLLKRHMPNEFVERMQVEQQTVGGVLVIEAAMSEEQYLARFGGRQPQPTLPILEQFRQELGLPASNTARDDDGLINVTPTKP